MVRVSVPARHRGALAQLSHLDAEQIQQLARGFESGEPLAQSLGEHLSNPGAVLDSLISMTVLRLTRDLTAQDVWAAVQSSLGEESGPADVSPLLDSPALIRESKIRDLNGAYDGLLEVGRILTDLRPVFAEDVTSPPKDFIITSLLELAYYSSGRSRQITIAMDEDDLDALMRQVERAKAKHQSLKHFLDKAGVHEAAPEGGE